MDYRVNSSYVQVENNNIINIIGNLEEGIENLTPERKP